MTVKLGSRSGVAFTLPVPTTDVILIAGQSNADGYGLTSADLPAHLVPSDAGIKIYNGTSFVTLTNGSNNALLCVGSSSTHTWGPEAEFTYQYRLVNPTKTVYIVKYAVDGTKLYNDGVANWNPAFAGSYFDQMVTYTNGALNALSGVSPTIKIRWLLWMQGESDATDSTIEANAYSANLVSFLSAVRDRWGRVGKTIVGRISASSAWTFSANVRNAQAATSLPDAWVNTDSYTLQADNKHYTGAGQVSLGSDMWAVR
jgi:Carbohydrate esterase, sialic acid-specific acetylesterase